jgi:hypothetical protein
MNPPIDPADDLRGEDLSGLAEPTFSLLMWRLLSTLVILASGAACYAAQLTGSQFYTDDFLYLQIARDAKVNLDWFVADNYGHFAPLTRLAYLVVQRSFGVNYRAAAIVPALLVVVIGAAMLSICRRMTGRTFPTLALTALSTSSVLVLRVVFWWGAAFHVLAALAACVVCIACFTGYCLEHRRRLLLSAVLALGVALLIQERPLLTIGYLVLLRYLLRCGLAPDVPVRRAIVRDRWMWAPFGVLLALYLGYRLLVFPSAPTTTKSSGALLFITSGWMRSFLPAVAGFRAGPVTGWITAQGVAGSAVILLAFVTLALRRVGSWRAITFFAAAYVANMVIVVLGRTVSAVPMSRDLQYFVDAFLALILALAFGFGCLPKRLRRHPSWQGHGRTVLIATVLLVFTSSARTWVLMVRSNDQTRAHHYMNRATDQLGKTVGPFDLVRLKLPPDVAAPFIAPYNDVRGVFTLDRGVNTALDSTSRTRVGVTASGDAVQLRPVTLAASSQSSPPSADGGGVITRRDAGYCLSGPGAAFIRLPLDRSVDASDLFFAIEYSASQDLSAQSLTSDGVDHVYSWNRTKVTEGRSQILVDRLEGTRVSELWIEVDRAVLDFCIKRWWIGNVGVDEGVAGCSVLDHYGGELRRVDRCADDWLAAAP